MKNSNKNISLVLGGIIFAVALALFLQYGNKTLNLGNVSGDGGSRPNFGVQTFESLIDKSVPDFALNDKDGRIYTPADLKGKSYLLFFNEGLMCYPACWDQIARFGTDERFNSGDIRAFSVIVDSPRNWNRAVEKMPELSSAIVLFDADASVSEKFNMLRTKSSMHFGVLPGHTYVVVDKNGIVRDVIDDPAMANRNNEMYQMMKNL